MTLSLEKRLSTFLVPWLAAASKDSFQLIEKFYVQLNNHMKVELTRSKCGQSQEGVFAEIFLPNILIQLKLFGPT